MAEDAPTIAPEDVYPHNPIPLNRDSDEVVGSAEKDLQERAHIDDVLSAIDTIASNSSVDEPQLIEFGKRMSSLIYYGGMTPSAAKARGAKDLFQQGRSKQDLADLLGMTRGGFNKLDSNGGQDELQSQRLHYMTFNVPMNLVLDETIAAEPPADYETRYIVLEVVAPQLEDEEAYTYTRNGPDTQLRPREPQYAVVREEHSPGRGNWSDDDPAERTFGTFCDMHIEWYMDETELIDALYETQYFNSEDRAATWQTVLEEYGFTTNSDPRERVNPDVVMENRESAR